MVLLSVMLPAIAQAAYVDLYRDVDFQNRLRRVEGIIPDRCYNLACGDLNNVITSAKWSGLPKKGAKVESIIAFYTTNGCPAHTHHWYRTRFPSYFKLDGINDAISSFMVLDTGIATSHWNLCTTESISLDTKNETQIEVTAGIIGDRGN